MDYHTIEATAICDLPLQDTWDSVGLFNRVAGNAVRNSATAGASSVTGPTDWLRLGQSFNGSQFATFTKLNPSSPFLLSLWYQSTLGVEVSTARLIGSNSSPTCGFVEDGARSLIVNTGSPSFTSVENFNGSINYRDGTWRHFAAYVNGTNGRIYRNSTQIVNATFSGGVTPTFAWDRIAAAGGSTSVACQLAGIHVIPNATVDMVPHLFGGPLAPYYTPSIASVYLNPNGVVNVGSWYNQGTGLHYDVGIYHNGDLKTVIEGYASQSIFRYGSGYYQATVLGQNDYGDSPYDPVESNYVEYTATATGLIQPIVRPLVRPIVNPIVS